MAEKKEPELTEILVSASSGAKVQIVQYQFTQDFHYSMSQKWSVPPMGIQEAARFREEKIKELQGHLDDVGQEKIDEYIDLRDRLREE